MSLLKTWPAALMLFVLGSVAVACGFGAILVHEATHPPRAHAGEIDFESMRMAVEEVAFDSLDGVHLAAWLLPGAEDGPAVVLCHDRGRSKASMLNLMIRLNEIGCTTLALDFRGHGDSAGSGSTLGLHEQRDVAGAIDFLRARDGEQRRPLGLYGVGMGAHAAVLAARDRPAVRVLVLDGLYPDVGFALNRAVYGRWRPGHRYFGFVPSSIFRLTTHASVSSQRADEALARLSGRHLLLVSPADDALLAEQIQRMYDHIPQTRDADGNLVTLPVTQTRDLYGAEVDRYYSRVAEFFRDRLLPIETVARR